MLLLLVRLHFDHNSMTHQSLHLDLFLIRPPPGASHTPVRPNHIVIGGDSAGGGLSLAVLQVIRDSGLPLPAGGVLISPWCDQTHCFPSIHTNTEKVFAHFHLFGAGTD